MAPKTLLVTTSVWIAALAGVWYGASGGFSRDGIRVALADDPPKKQFSVVPLRVNVLKGVTFSDDDIEATVKEANRILKQANIRFEFEKARDISRDVSDQGNNDGILDAPEFTKVGQAALDELRKYFGPGKGYKVVVTTRISVTAESAAFTGASPHNPETPVTFLKTPSAGIDNERRGNVLAHEFGHVMTLGKNHVIVSPTLKADNTSHHPTDTNNLMYPNDPYLDGNGQPASRGSALTEDQRKEIQGGAKKRGFARFETARLESRSGSWTHTAGDAQPQYVSLSSGTLYAEGLESDLQVTINLRGLFPGNPVTTEFDLLFDTDHDSGTGSMVGSFAGIDKQLRITLDGQYPFTSTPQSIRSDFIVLPGGTPMSLSPATVTRIDTIFDAEQGSLPVTRESANSLQQSLPFALLGNPANTIAVGIRAVEGGAVDETGLLYDLQPPARTLVVSTATGAPGSTIVVTGTGYTQLSTVTLKVDDTLMMTATTRADGSFTGVFAFPPAPAGDYFMTGRDDSGLFDFAMFANTGRVYVPIGVAGYRGGW